MAVPLRVAQEILCSCNDCVAVCLHHDARVLDHRRNRRHGRGHSRETPRRRFEDELGKSLGGSGWVHEQVSRIEDAEDVATAQASVEGHVIADAECRCPLLQRPACGTIADDVEVCRKPLLVQFGEGLDGGVGALVGDETAAGDQTRGPWRRRSAGGKPGCRFEVLGPYRR